MAWHIITQGNGYISNYTEFLIDSEEDIETPPEDIDYGPSSLAHTPGYGSIYEADAEGEWVLIGGGDGLNDVDIGSDVK